MDDSKLLQEWNIITRQPCRPFAGCHITSYRELRVKDLPKVLTWWLEWDSNLQASGQKAANLPLRHHAPLMQ